MNRFILITAFVLTALSVNAQALEGGIFFGISNYQGDLVEPLIELKETKLGYGIFLRYNFYDYVSLRGSFYGGSISGTDDNAVQIGRRNRQASFNSKLYEFSLNGEWNILGNPFSGYVNAKKRLLYPYVSVGVGMNYVDPIVLQGEGNLNPEEEHYKKVNLVIPFCGGVKFKINDRAVLGMEAGFRTAFSDYLDGISILGNPKWNDWYMFAGINVAAVIGEGHY